MSNYLQHLLTKYLELLDPGKQEEEYKSRVFYPFLEKEEDDNQKKDIEQHHVAWLHSSMMTHMLSSDQLISNMYNSRNWFNHCDPATQSMPKDCLQYLIVCCTLLMIGRLMTT